MPKRLSAEQDLIAKRQLQRHRSSRKEEPRAIDPTNPYFGHPVQVRYVHFIFDHPFQLLCQINSITSLILLFVRCISKDAVSPGKFSSGRSTFGHWKQQHLLQNLDWWWVIEILARLPEALNPTMMWVLCQLSNFLRKSGFLFMMQRLLKEYLRQQLPP